jgi:hypothetical protein
MTENATEKNECSECGGFGSIGDGPFTVGMECPGCDGQGVTDISRQGKTTEAVSLEVLGKTYDEFKYDERFVRHVVATLEDPDMASVRDAGGASNAAVWLRSSLWVGHGGGFEMASRATCDLFYTLGRQDELGWIEGMVPNYHFEG